MNRFDWIEFWTDVIPNKVAAIDASSHQSLTYADLNDMGRKLSRYLQQEYDFRKGDRVVVIAQNCFEYLYLFSAAQKIGFCIIPLNYRLTINEIDQLINESDADLILYASEFADLFSEKNNAVDLDEFFSKVDGIDQNLEYNKVELQEDDAIFILFTSGSSGFPKGVKYTHKMMFWNSINTQISLVLHSKTKTVICMPPFHTGGWNVLLTPILHVGGQVILMHKFEAESVLELLETHGCQVFMGVPTMLQMMRDHNRYDQANLTSLEYIIVGGEAMSLSLIQDYHKKGIPIRQGYGMTEVGPNLTSLHEDQTIQKIGSIGKPNMYVETKIVKEDGQDVLPGEPGELWLNGPIVTPGYFNQSFNTSSPFEEDGWFRTGDVVLKDKDGFLYIVDRKKNMYISGGENVYPAEIERVLTRHPHISEVAVVGVPDERWGEVGYALIYCQEDHELTVAEINKYCLDHLSKYKIPKHFKIVDHLPKTDTGKIDRRQIQRQANEVVRS